MDRLPGARKVIVDYPKKRCFVRYDAKKLTVAKIIHRIEEIGFQAKEDKEAKWPDDKKR